MGHRHRGHAGWGCGCRRHGHHGGDCGCGGHQPMKRRFWSREEKIAWLEHYLQDLQNEAQAVKERLAALQAEDQLAAGC